MIIHLFRHGIAIDRADPECPDDAERYLTRRGIRRTKAAARGLRRLGVSADLVLTSPFVRARQTADIAIKQLKLKAPLQETEALKWDAEPEALREVLAGLGIWKAGKGNGPVEEVLCAGHAPQLDLFIAHMVGTPMPVTELKKAGLATLHSDFTDPGDGTLLALFPPRALRNLGD